MKNIIRKWFHAFFTPSTDVKLKNLRELRAIEYENGVKVYVDLLADVLSAKTEVINSSTGNDDTRYRPRALSVSKTIYP